MNSAKYLAPFPVWRLIVARSSADIRMTALILLLVALTNSISADLSQIRYCLPSQFLLHLQYYIQDYQHQTGLNRQSMLQH